VPDSRKAEPPGGHLKDIVAPALRFFDRLPALRVGGKERRIGAELVEKAGDPAVRLDSLAVELECGNRSHPVRGREHGIATIAEAPE
jgi:hypothetical protein